MTRSTNIRHYRRFILLIRQLTNSAADKNSGENINKNKLFGQLNVLWKTKMSMQNYSKLVAQLKDYLHKSGYDRNLQVVLSKDWIDFLQKLTYTQINVFKKLSPIEFTKSTSNSKLSHVDKCDTNTQVKSNKSLLETHQGETFREQKAHQPIYDATVSEPKVQIKEPSSLSQILGSLIVKLTSKSSTATLVIPPKWKVNIHKDIPKHSIQSRTRHVLNSITTAESSTSRWRRIEDLLTHIDQYPEARHYAIKEGAIRILLKIKRKTKNEEINASIREALAVLGYVDPLPGRGIRILSIDGGGVRGVLVVEMLKKLEELTGKKTHEMFDYICGVSTGAILAATLVIPKDSNTGGHKRKSLHEISELYRELSTKVFTQSAIKGTSNLVWSHAYYDTPLWEKLLQEHLGDRVLIKTARDLNAPKFSAISAVVNHARVMAYVFRNYTLPHRVESQYIGSHKHKLWEAVRASAAAPSYFEEFKHGECLHQDGGILVNNPCAVALHEAKQLWPNNPIQCVISFGTGRTPNRICENNESTELAISSWKEKFYKILDSATDTEAVHTMLNDLLPEHVYFRFNPYLTEMLSMVEIRPEKITQLEQDAKMYIRRNEEKFQKAAKVLLERRQIQQKVMDWIVLQKKISGL
ncbi:calcium-independent phospholipase A2-gamma-like isoform X1 [Hylaeus anthracinus]|uniref:calcium-independent phospholipase A2-gamma-like isoform X1 n=2 Tax=Hylaeus anthracinus TaxID=313031 RepID=UPI0023B894D7|nr:calcium-independent phospholipase A2-gamma-like isoform X1 [Hylaeus anthracinus]